MKTRRLRKTKIRIFLVVLMIAIIGLAGCGGGVEEPEEAPTSEELPIFTMEEIKDFDGRDGKPAYIVVEGLVYDVTESRMWSDGLHQGQHQAGQDLTDEIMEESPHGTGVLDRMEVVGQIAE